MPEFRVTESYPFTSTGCDFAGPLYCKHSRNAPEEKIYICIFTCCSTRGVHLELVSDLTADCFLRAFRRFVARRGLPLRLVSDNGKTFKNAEKKLAALFELPDVQEYLARKRISWRYDLPTASWWGGLFERLIGMTKRCLRKIVGRASLTYDEINTVIVEVECVLNSRPFTYVSAKDQEEILTPSHSLNGRNISSLPELSKFREVLHDANYDIEKRELFTKRSIHLGNVLKHFWNLWRKHYLVELREHHKVKGRVTGRSSIINVG